MPEAVSTGSWGWRTEDSDKYGTWVRTSDGTTTTETYTPHGEWRGGAFYTYTELDFLSRLERIEGKLEKLLASGTLLREDAPQSAAEGEA